MASSAQSLGSVLVVGGCGFLGHHIVRFLLDDPSCDSVAVLDKNVQRNRFPGVSYHQGDITSLDAVRDIFNDVRPRVIISTVSPIPHQDRPDPSMYQRVNVDGTANLLECAARTPSVVAFVYTSTVAVIAGSEFNLADESYPYVSGRLPRDPYRETKAKADALVLQANNPRAADGAGLRTACIRPAGMFGEGDYLTIPPILDLVEQGQTHIQMGSNNTLFDFVYVQNVAEAIIMAAKALLAGENDPRAPKVDGEAFFITNDEPVLYWNFVRSVWAAAGYRASPEKAWVIHNQLAMALASVVEWLVLLMSCGRRRPKQFVRHLVEYCCMTRTYSIAKAKERLGYAPRVNVNEGIRKGVDWALKEMNWKFVGRLKEE